MAGGGIPTALLGFASSYMQGQRENRRYSDRQRIIEADERRRDARAGRDDTRFANEQEEYDYRKGQRPAREEMLAAAELRRGDENLRKNQLFRSNMDTAQALSREREVDRKFKLKKRGRGEESRVEAEIDQLTPLVYRAYKNQNKPNEFRYLQRLNKLFGKRIDQPILHIQPGPLPGEDPNKKETWTGVIFGGADGVVKYNGQPMLYPVKALEQQLAAMQPPTKWGGGPGVVYEKETRGGRLPRMMSTQGKGGRGLTPTEELAESRERRLRLSEGKKDIGKIYKLQFDRAGYYLEGGDIEGYVQAMRIYEELLHNSYRIQDAVGAVADLKKRVEAANIKYPKTPLSISEYWKQVRKAFLVRGRGGQPRGTGLRGAGKPPPVKGKPTPQTPVRPNPLADLRRAAGGKDLSTTTRTGASRPRSGIGIPQTGATYNKSKLNAHERNRLDLMESLQFAVPEKIKEVWEGLPNIVKMRIWRQLPPSVARHLTPPEVKQGSAGM